MRDHRHQARPCWLVLLVLLAGSVLPGADTASREVRIGTFPLEPLNFLDEEGVASGLYPDLLREIARVRGWDLIFVNGSWADGLAAVQAGEIDLMTTIAYTPERDQVLDFSQEPVCDIWGQVFHRPDGAVAGIRDLSGARVGIMQRDINGSNFRDLVQRLGVGCELVEYPTHEAIFRAVAAGELLAGVAPQHFGLRHGDAHGLVASSILFAPFSVFVATREGQNADLLAAIDEQLQRWRGKADSFYYQRLNHWMGSTTIERRIVPPWLLVVIAGAVGLALVLMAANRVLNLQVRRRTAELREREAAYRDLVESANCVVLRLAPDGRIRYINPYGERLFGYRADELVDRAVVGTLLPEADEDGTATADLVRQAFAEPERFQLYECESVCKDGSRVFLQWSNRVRHDSQGSVQEMLSIGIDNTERRRLVNDLLYARKMEALGTLAGGVAHDFNNMLAGILGAAEMLRDGPEAKRETYLDVIIHSCGRAADLVRQMLAFGRRGEVVLEPVDLPRVIADACVLLERSIDKKVRIELDCAPDTGWVHGDAAQLQNLVINLGINASHAMLPDGGLLRIAARRLRIDTPLQQGGRTLEPGIYVRLMVSDEGCGIPEHLREKVFEPFFTTKQRGVGSGLGLAAVFGIIQSHAGAIAVDSVEGEGTTFTIHLPGCPAGEAGSGLRPVVTQTRRGATILVIDDEDDVRAVTVAQLGSLGFTVREAADGRAGLELYRRERSTIDAVLLDMVMPELGGRETFRALRELDPDLPVVLASGYAEDGSIAELRAEGLAGYLVKPYRLKDLSRVVNGLFASGSD